MKNVERYFRSVKILLDGFENETLFHNNWGGCIDAHLIAANMGFTLTPLTMDKHILGMGWLDKGQPVQTGSLRDWGKLLNATNFRRRWSLRSDIGKKRYRWAGQCVTATGYTKRELRKIMHEFDKYYDDENEFKNILAGLKAVLVKLKQIHAVSDMDLSVKYKKAFDQEQKILDGYVDEIYPSVLRFQQDNRFNYKAYISQKQAEVIYTVLHPGSSVLLAAS